MTTVPAVRRSAGRLGGEEPYRFAEKCLAAAALSALGFRQFVGNGVTSGYVLAFLLFPLWIGVVRRYWGARVFLLLGALAVVAGVVLGTVDEASNAVNRSGQVNDSMLLVGTLAGVGIILWARAIFGIGWVGAWFGLGMLAAAAAGPGLHSVNPWKFVWGIPLGVFLLSLAVISGRRLVELSVLAALAGASALLDSRSYFATFLLAAALLCWQMRPQRLSRSASWGWTAFLMGGLAVGVYYLGQSLLVSGALGAAAQQRSVQQIDTAGSLILGGRPELAATAALFRDRVWGFGTGAVPTYHDVLVAKVGMAGVGYDPNNGYVENFMFAGQFELHSILGDMWANYGLVGIAVAVTVALLLIRGIALTVARRTGSGVAIFLSCWTLWNLLFSPLYGSAPTLMLGVGLALVVSERSDSPP